MSPSRGQKLAAVPGSIPASPSPVSRDTTERDDDTIIPISNAPVIDAPDVDNFSNPLALEVYRLRRRVTELECIVRDRDERVALAIARLETEKTFWRSAIYDNVWPTLGQLNKLLIEFDAVLSRLKEHGSRYYPTLDLPAAWKKSNADER